jgi:hypothetical protein
MFILIIEYINKLKHTTISRRISMAIRLILGLVLGAVAGFLLYRFVGCSSGTCPITGNPFISTLYGAVIGALASGAFSH